MSTHLAAALSDYLARHTRAELAADAGISASTVTRLLDAVSAFNPTPALAAKIVGGIATREPDAAPGVLAAFLRDQVPPGDAPDGIPWETHVQVSVAPLAVGGVLRESAPLVRPPKLERAISWFIRGVRSRKDLRAYLMALYGVAFPAEAEAAQAPGAETTKPPPPCPNHPPTLNRDATPTFPAPAVRPPAEPVFTKRASTPTTPPSGPTLRPPRGIRAVVEGEGGAKNPGAR
jgi:hypothetical protein